MKISTVEVRHQAALADYLADFEAAGEDSVPGWFAPRDWPWPKVVEQVNGWSRGEFLQPGWVPCTTLLLEDEGVVLGNVNIRHELDSRLLRFGGHIGYSVRPSARRRGHAARLLAAGLEVTRQLGCERALLTCAPENIGSVKPIERAGGVLEEESWQEEHQRVVRRYWISLQD